MSESVTVSEHDLEVNGITLHYVTWGTFTAPERAVLLIHGLTANGYSWAGLGPTLAGQGWYAIAPDLRGRGLSSKPPHGYGTPYHVNDLLALCDALSLPTVHCIGHSLGAFIAFFLAGVHPKRLGRLVLVDRGGSIPADALQAIGPSLQRLGQVYPSLDAYLEERKQSPVYQWNLLWEAYFRYDANVHPDGTVTSRVLKAAIEEEFRVDTTINPDVPLSRITAPTLILRAGLGTISPTAGFILAADEAERVRGLIPGSRLVTIADTNHYTIIMAGAFRREVLAFLEEAPKSAGD